MSDCTVTEQENTEQGERSKDGQTDHFAERTVEQREIHTGKGAADPDPGEAERTVRDRLH